MCRSGWRRLMTQEDSKRDRTYKHGCGRGKYPGCREQPDSVGRTSTSSYIAYNPGSQVFGSLVVSHRTLKLRLKPRSLLEQLPTVLTTLEVGENFVVCFHKQFVVQIRVKVRPNFPASATIE